MARTVSNSQTMAKDPSSSLWLPDLLNPTPSTGSNVRRRLISDVPRGAKRAPWPRAAYHAGPTQAVQSTSGLPKKLGQSQSLPNMASTFMSSSSSCCNDAEWLSPKQGYDQNLNATMTNGFLRQHSTSAGRWGSPNRTVNWPRPGASASNWRVPRKGASNWSPRSNHDEGMSPRRIDTFAAEEVISDDDTWEEDYSERGQSNSWSPRREADGAPAWEGCAAPAHWRRALLRPMKLKAKARRPAPVSSNSFVREREKPCWPLPHLVSAPATFSQTPVSSKSRGV